MYRNTGNSNPWISANKSMLLKQRWACIIWRNWTIFELLYKWHGMGSIWCHALSVLQSVIPYIANRTHPSASMISTAEIIPRSAVLLADWHHFIIAYLLTWLRKLSFWGKSHYLWQQFCPYLLHLEWIMLLHQSLDTFKINWSTILPIKMSVAFYETDIPLCMSMKLWGRINIGDNLTSWCPCPGHETDYTLDPTCLCK